MELRASSGLLTAALVSVAVCLASPQPAFARGHGGGGHGGGGHSGGGHGGGGFGGGHSSHGSSRGYSGGFGRSSSVGTARGYRAFTYPGGRASGRYVPSRGWGWSGGNSYGYPLYPRSWGYPVWGYGFGYVPSYPVDQGVIVDGQPLAAESYPEESAVAVAGAADVMMSSAGPLLGAQLSVEGETLGFVLGYTAAFPPIGGTDQVDTLHLAIAHMTFALLTSERGRVRGEVGVHLAAAPLATFVAPGVGLSAAFGLVGPLGLEARVYGNAWPYTEVDARAGLALSFRGVGFGAGIRALYLNDNGALGDVNAGQTSDTFVGPYATLAIAL